MLLNPVFQNLLLSGWLIDARCEKLCFKPLLTPELCNTHTHRLAFPNLHSQLLVPGLSEQASRDQLRGGQVGITLSGSASREVQRASSQYPWKGGKVLCSHQQETEWEVNHLSLLAGT